MEKPYLYDSAFLPPGFQYPQSFLDFIAQADDVSNIFPWRFSGYHGKDAAVGWKEEAKSALNTSVNPNSVPIQDQC